MATGSFVDDRRNVWPPLPAPATVRVLLVGVSVGLLVFDQSVLRGSALSHLADAAVALGPFGAALVWVRRGARATPAVMALIGGAGWCLAGLDPHVSALWWPTMAAMVVPALRTGGQWVAWSAVTVLAGAAAARALEAEPTDGILAVVGSAVLLLAVLVGIRGRGAGRHWMRRAGEIGPGLLVGLGIGLPAALTMSGSDRLASAGLAVGTALLTGGGVALLLAASADPGPGAAVTDHAIELAGLTGAAGLPGLISPRDVAPAPSAYAAALALLEANHTLVSELEAQVGRSRALQRRLVTAADEQRARLAGELRSSVRPLFDQLTTTLRTAETGVGLPAAREAVHEALREVELVHDDLHRIAQGLHPRLLVSGGLSAALADLAARLPLDVTARAPAERFAATLESALWYVCAEALTNAVKHSGATSASVTVERVADELVATITDDGRVGLDVDIEAEGAVGLAGVRDRMAAYGGTLKVVARPSGGLAVMARVPC